MHQQLAVAWDDFDDKFRLDKKVVDDNNIFGSDFEWWKRQEDFEIERSDKEGALPYPLVDFDSSKGQTSKLWRTGAAYSNMYSAL